LQQNESCGVTLGVVMAMILCLSHATRTN
jgi:hypothetical protein